MSNQNFQGQINASYENNGFLNVKHPTDQKQFISSDFGSSRQTNVEYSKDMRFSGALDLQKKNQAYKNRQTAQKDDIQRYQSQDGLLKKTNTYSATNTNLRMSGTSSLIESNEGDDVKKMVTRVTIQSESFVTEVDENNESDNHDSDADSK